MDERAFIAEVERADVDKLAKLLAQPAKDQENALIAHFGEDRYRRLHSLAVKRSVSRGTKGALKGNVVVIHGIMGGELSAFDRKATRHDVWVSVFALMRGHLKRLRLGLDGRAEYDPEYDVRATGIMKSHYGELLLTLAQNWNVRAFWFDWRKDLKLAAASLEANMQNWFDKTDPVHIVAHSMGGLVARNFIKHYRSRWDAMLDTRNNGTRGGRLVMLGTPNYGSFIIPQLLTGLEPMVKRLAKYSFGLNREAVTEIVNTFPGCYQMLPAPFAVPKEHGLALYQSGTYAGTASQKHLDRARSDHDELKDVVDLERMIYLAGTNQPTPSGIRDVAKLNSLDGYDATYAGDGRVTHELGILRLGNKEIPAYYIPDDHGNLPRNEEILAAIDQLLVTGKTDALAGPSRAPVRSDADRVKARKALREEYTRSEERIEELIRSLDRNRALVRAGHTNGSIVLPDERRLAEEITRGFLTHGPGDMRRPERKSRPVPPKLSIRLLHESIEQFDPAGAGTDAISVGHYMGVKPVAAERAIDEAISRRVYGTAPAQGTGDDDLLITRYSERGTIRGELAQFFFLPDPRVKGAKHGNDGRVIVIAGLGLPGNFGVPELKLLVRELAWALAQVGKRRLATVVIGSGIGNIPIREAISAWLSGLRQSMIGSTQERAIHLEEVTFVERNARVVLEIDQALAEEKERWAAAKQEDKWEILYTRRTPSEILKLKKSAMEAARKEWQDAQKNSNQRNQREKLPTRLTVALQNDVYRFGAITEIASVPERLIRLNPAVVMNANQELAVEDNPSTQVERGQFLENLLIPDDIRSTIYTDAPLVVILDSTTARIHWEMMAPPESSTSGPQTADPNLERYLGTSRGLTRQFRTSFAPPPEPPPPPRRRMRVMIVADPAEDAPLPGAQAEGAELAELFEAFNSAYGETENSIDVLTLFGPRDATITNVLRELTLRHYDVLHFAGHCIYVPDSPESSGWIFSGGQRLSANELNRIDRVPKFVFSNACESGVTPDRPEGRTVELAPSFAEAFFGRGVANFVCTAWPVDDVAAREFARTLYGRLLGLTRNDREAILYSKTDPDYMYAAMREARRVVAATNYGIRTWGAYQHYGNPHFGFFDRQSLMPPVQVTTRRSRKTAR